MKKNPHQVLGIPPQATLDEIKKAYRKLAIKFHPDRNPGDKKAEAIFKEIAEAYHELMDSPPLRPPKGASSKTHEGPADVHQKKRPGPPGGDLRYVVTLTLEEVANGTERNIKFIRKNGNTDEQTRLNVKIPPGLGNGQKLRIKSEGDAATANGTRGDLYILITVTSHPLFTQEGLNLTLEYPITFSMAACGGTILVPTVYGDVDLELPEGVAPGQIFRLKGKGMPSPSQANQKGDLYVKTLMDIPKGLTAKQSSLLKTFDSGQIYPLRENFLKKLGQIKKGSGS